ncbi:MAG: sulfatase-like hydrolase/transferase [Verrucomicrobiae bacterium]|nr:sulfatase-like hydrolase/transferase [Verrucomicrobiae bacterium]
MKQADKVKLWLKSVQVGCLFSLLVVLFLSGCSRQANTKPSTPPNIILIVADDQGYADLSVAGTLDDVSTPNIDRLAQQGIRFTQAYASSPICNTSRCAIITGAYQQRFGMQWYGGPGITNWNHPTLPELLKEAGYTNGYVGKVHYGSPKEAGSRNFPLDHGFDSFFGYLNARIHYLIHNREYQENFDALRAENPEHSNSWGMGPFMDNLQEVDMEGMSTEIFGQKAREFISAEKDNPFFLYLSFNAVHNFTHQLPESYLKEQGLEDYGDWDPRKEPYIDWYRRSRLPNNPDGRAHYLGQLYYLDQEVGRLLDHLDQLGIRENTFIFYIGDNGGSTPIYAMNTPLRGSKYTLYEGGTRVPMIISQPGTLPENRTVANVVSAMDILPTFLSVAGRSVPDFTDGVDLAPLLNGKNQDLHHEVLHWKTADEWSVRKGDWKLHQVDGPGSSESEMVELELGTFLRDLREDPGEKINFADAHPEIVAELRALHEAWVKDLPVSKSNTPSPTEWAEPPKQP